MSGYSAHREITPVYADFLVADAVLPKRSPTGFFSVTGNLLQNEAKNRGCRLPLGYLSCRSVCDFNGYYKDRSVSCSLRKQTWFGALSGVFGRLIRRDSEQEQVAPLKIRKPSIGTHLLADDRPVLLLARDSS
jgi:hypothetical protein